MKIRRTDTYTVAIINDKSIFDDLSDCMIISCGNKTQLEAITEIPKDRLVYIFTKLKKKVWVENGKFIIKSDQYRKGNQIGGLRNPALGKLSNIDY